MSTPEFPVSHYALAASALEARARLLEDLSNTPATPSWGERYRAEADATRRAAEDFRALAERLANPDPDPDSAMADYLESEPVWRVVLDGTFDQWSIVNYVEALSEEEARDLFYKRPTTRSIVSVRRATRADAAEVQRLIDEEGEPRIWQRYFSDGDERPDLRSIPPGLRCERCGGDGMEYTERGIGELDVRCQACFGTGRKPE